MRVLMVTPVIPDLSSSDPGASVATMASVPRQIRSLEAVGVETDVLQIDGMPKLRYLQCLPRVVARARFADVVHAHYGFSGWLARAQLRRPVVMSFMGTDVLGVPRADGSLKPSSRFAMRVNRRLARTFDAVIVKSPEMAAAVAPAVAEVVPNGVDLDAFAPIPREAARARLGLDDSRRYVLFGGRPSNPRKNYALASAAASRAAATIGEPIELLALDGVPPGEVPVYMSACEALLMTSLIEGSPNVVKEAMASDLAVVAVPVGDVVQLLEGVRRSVVVARDEQAVAAALAETLRSGARSNGRDALRRKGLDATGVARRIVDIYRRVAAEPAPARDAVDGVVGQAERV
jgi:glycosyltransferase involved in cell wall biosynthesis